MSKAEAERIAIQGRRIGNGIFSDSSGEYFFLDGKQVSEEAYRNLYPIPDGGKPSGKKSGGWPQKSEALACDPSQVAEMNERNRAAGLGTRYNRDGTAVIPDRNERKKLLRLEGIHDKQGGYGD